MTTQTKAQIIQLLVDTHVYTKAAIEKVGAETMVHPEGGWRVRDVVAHLIGWDQVLADGFRAYREGREYIAPGADDYDAFNVQVVEQYKDFTADALLAEWEEVHGALKAALEAIPDDKIDDEMLFPWNERGRIPDVMKGMAGHEKAHADGILTAGG